MNKSTVQVGLCQTFAKAQQGRLEEGSVRGATEVQYLRMKWFISRGLSF